MDQFGLATKATHMLGDISRDKPDYCIIKSEDGDDYIGNWLEGFGFINVRFPKATTKILEGEELAAAKEYASHLKIGSMFG